MRDPDIEAWHADNKAEYDYAQKHDFAEYENSDDDEEEEWECPLCGRVTCPGTCPV